MGTLSTTLASNQQAIGVSTGTGWAQFVLDHLDYIARRSATYVIDAVTMNDYRYDLQRYLTEKLTHRLDIQWIVLRLNSLPNDLAFDQPGKYIIPSEDLINNLYHTFVTISNNAS